MDKTKEQLINEWVEEQARYQAYLIANVSDAIFVFNEQFVITFWNPAAERIYGWKSEEIIGRTTKNIIRTEFLGTERSKVMQTLAETGEFRGEMVHYRKDGKPIYVEGHAIALKDTEGRITEYVNVNRDITERKLAEEELSATNEELQAAEEELRATNEELHQLNQELEQRVEQRTKELRDAQEQVVRQEKLAVLGQLAGGVSHELRNPLGAIKQAAYFLNMAVEKPEPEIKETLEIPEKEVATSERIISSLLDFARPKPPTRQKIDINNVVQGGLSRTAVPENVKVVKKLDKALPIILADPGQLEQVFINIIHNAIQAMPEGGQLVIRSEVHSPEWVAVSFEDTGVGISKENLVKLFEPLFTTKAKGIGLGLAVTRTLVEEHGGNIEVQSEVGKGSIFTVKLPIGAKGRK